MNPLSLRLRNYRTFKNLDLPLPSGCVAIVGPNGAGKSSLANVVDLALFGPNGRSWSPYLTAGAEATEMMLELVFEHAGETYRVRRGYSGRGKGKATFDFELHGEVSDDPEEMQPPPDWHPLTREKIDATQELIEQTIGLTRETFRASSMLVQGDGAAFTEAQPRDRKAILGKILGLERFDRLLELVRRDKRAAEAKLQRIAGALEVADVERATKDDVANSLKAVSAAAGMLDEALTEATAELESAARAATLANELRAEHAEALAKVTRLESELRPLEERVRNAEQAETERASLEEELATLATPAQSVEREKAVATLEQEVEGHRQAAIRHDDAQALLELRRAERNAILGRARDLNEKAHANREEAKLLEENGPGAATCEVCQQTLGAEALASTLAHLRTEADDLDAAAKDLDAQAAAIELPDVPEQGPVRAGLSLELSAARRALEEARNDELQRVRLEERLRALAKAQIDRPLKRDVIAARAAVETAKRAAGEVAPPGPDELAVLQAAAISARARVDEIREKRETTQAELVLQRARLERLEDLERSTAAQRSERERLRIDLDRLAILERAYGRDGIPALIVQNAAIPSIETEACRILAELGTSYRVELRTEKALAGGGSADALDVVITTEEGERPYETFSGGERTRINLALRIALARLLAHRRGAESRLLVIDEPEFLDADGTAALARVLEGLAGDFERVYLISHVPDLRDSFDQTIEIVRDGDGRSRLAA